MKRIRFRLVHLIILVTMICIAVPATEAMRHYRHKRRIERLNEISAELLSEWDAQVANITARSAPMRTSAERNAELDARMKDMARRDQYVAKLRDEYKELKRQEPKYKSPR